MQFLHNKPGLFFEAVITAGGLGFGGGVDFPKECFFGDTPVIGGTIGKDVGCLSFLTRGEDLKEFLLPPPVNRSELPFNFSRLLLELDDTTSSNEFPFCPVFCNLAPGGRRGFLLLA